jgi:hypothetical protein
MLCKTFTCAATSLISFRLLSLSCALPQLLHHPYRCQNNPTQPVTALNIITSCSPLSGCQNVNCSWPLPSKQLWQSCNVHRFELKILTTLNPGLQLFLDAFWQWFISPHHSTMRGRKWFFKVLGSSFHHAFWRLSRQQHFSNGVTFYFLQ